MDSTTAPAGKVSVSKHAWQDRETGEGPLAGIRVLELAAIIAGAFSGMLLADFGADVIKVEHPTGDPYRQLGNKRDGTALDWKRLGRNKRLIALDLHDPASQEIIRDLAAQADVVTENFRPGTLEKWGIGYEQLKLRNPRLVMLRVTGWGQDGPHRDRPGFGSVAEAMAGFAALNGEKNGPPLLPPFGLADHLTGVYGAFAIMTALRERDRSGEGQVIDLALYESIFSILGGMVIDYDQIGFVQERNGNRVYYSSPRNVYKTRDGRYVALSGSTANTAQRVFSAIGKPDLYHDAKFNTNTARLANADELDAMIADWMIAHPFEEVMRVFNNEKVALAPVQDISQIIEDEHFIAREAIVSVEDEEWGPVRMPGVVPRFSRTPGKIKWSGARLGRHQDEILVTDKG
jgi:formyl-CoA transferase